MKNITEQDIEYFTNGETEYDSPGFIDGFLHGMKMPFKQLSLFFTKGASENHPRYVFGIPLHETEDNTPFSKPIEREYEEGIQEKVEAIGDGNSKSAFDWVRTLDEFEQQKEYLEERSKDFSGWGAVGEFAGEMLNPITLGEFGLAGKAVNGAKAFGSFLSRALGNNTFKFLGITNKLSPTALKIGKSALKSGADMAVYSYVDQSIDKYVGIPIENIGCNTTWNALLGMALGGVTASIGPAITKLRRKNIKENLTPGIKEKILNDFQDSKVELILDESEGGEIQEIKVDGQTSKLLNNRLAGAIPLVKGLTSKNEVVRKLTDAFFKHQYTNLGESGISTPVESEMSQWMGLKIESWDIINKHWKKYKKEGYGKREDFNRSLSFAMIDGDKHNNPIISGCAKELRTRMDIAMDKGLEYDIYDDLFDDIFDEEGNRLRKVTKEDLNKKFQKVNDRSYFPRKFNVDRIYAEPENWEKDIKNLIRRYQPKFSEEDVSAVFRDIDSTIKGISLDDIPTFEALEKHLVKEGQQKESVVKARRIPFSSKDLFKWLEQDPIKLTDTYFTGTGYEIAQKRVLRDLGYEKYQEVLEAAENTRSDVVSKEDVEEMEFLRMIPKLIRGSVSREYGKVLNTRSGNKTVRNIQGAMSALNVVTLLGRVAISVMEDIALTASKRGLIRHIAEMINSVFGKTFENMNKQELQRYGIACESLSGRIRSMVSYGDETWNWPMKLSSKFMEATGLPMLDDFRAEIISNDLVVELAEKILKGEKFDTRLNQKSLELIREELKKHSKKTEYGITDTNISGWKSFDAKRDFMSEVERLLRQEIVQPGAGDIPLFIKTPLGKLVAMFQGFNFALTNNVLLPLLVKGYKGELSKLMVYGWGFAALSTIIRGYLTNNPYDLGSLEFARDTLSRMPLGILGIGAEFLFDSAKSIYEKDINMRSMNDIIYSLVKGGNANWLMRAGEALQYVYNNAVGSSNSKLRRYGR